MVFERWVLKVFAFLCTFCGIFARFAQFLGIFAHLLCVKFSGSNLCQCYFVSVFHLWLIEPTSEGLLHGDSQRLQLSAESRKSAVSFLALVTEIEDLFLTLILYICLQWSAMVCTAAEIRPDMGCRPGSKIWSKTYKVFSLREKIFKNEYFSLKYVFVTNCDITISQCSSLRFGGCWSSPNLKFSRLREINQYKTVVHHITTTWSRYLFKFCSR